MPMWMRKRLLMEETPGAGGGGNPPAPPAPPAGDPPAPPSPPAGTPPAPPAGDPPAPPAPPKSDWSDDWRTKLAGEKPDKQLDRFSSPKDVYTAWKALQTRLSSGELKSALPKDAKPEEVAKWRAENGVPEKPDGYKLPDGLVVGDADKPHIEGFMAKMHAKNAPPEVVAEGVAYYYEMQEKATAQIAEADVTHKTEMEDTLRAEWAGEYRQNVNAVTAMLTTAPGGIADKILSARMGDGRAIANDPDVLRWLASTARELNPVATVVPAGGDQMGAITDEIGKIEKLMGNRQSEYWKGPTADKMQARYRQLIEARERKK